MSMNGIDISSWQSSIDLRNVPFDFVIVKATEGINYVNPTCDKHIQQAIFLGKKWGFYHFAAGNDPVVEANHFYQNCKNYFGNGIPALDYESYGRKGVAWVKKFLDRIYELTKVRCMVYMSQSVTNEEDFTEVAKHHALWMAQYATNSKTGYQANPWSQGNVGAWNGIVTIHQYSSNGYIGGYNGPLDLNIAYLTPDGWDRIARGDIDATQAQQQTDRLSLCLDQLADATIYGAFGDGEVRVNKLGINYDDVMKRVNEKTLK